MLPFSTTTNQDDSQPEVQQGSSKYLPSASSSRPLFAPPFFHCSQAWAVAFDQEWFNIDSTTYSGDNFYSIEIVAVNERYLFFQGTLDQTGREMFLYDMQLRELSASVKTNL